MLFINPRLETTFFRATLGLSCGASAATAVNVLWIGVIDGQSSAQGVAETIDGLFVFIVVSTLLWYAGAFTLGAAGWAILHRMSARGPAMAFLYGAGLPAGMIALLPRPAIWVSYIAAGGVAGLVVWAVSYGPIRGPEPQVAE